MPKIEVIRKALDSALGEKLSDNQLEELLPVAKAELDEVNNEEGTLKIELNDTNRPDLWSTTGLARQLRVYRGAKAPSYSFLSSREHTLDSAKRLVKVDASCQNVRPYIVAFAVSGKKINEADLKDIIQTQEKLCWNFGQKRKAIAMGVYRSDLMTYPVHYKAVDPQKTRFVPLGLEKELNLREIIKEHPKGQEFGHIVADKEAFPFLTDNNDQVLSFPPIINSAKIGAVEEGDSELFIEMTGTDLSSLVLAANIVACDFADSGFEILPVKIEYPYDTPFGREITIPYYFQKKTSASFAQIKQILGDDLSKEQISSYLKKMGVDAQISDNMVDVLPPVYRNDFLHAVDIAEDIIIGRGMDSFASELPSDFTVGRLTDEEIFGRKAGQIMIGLGFQEMIYNYLGSGKDFIEKMNLAEDNLVQISNPMSENYEYIRNSILPCLLSSEAVSANAVYPHRIFEIGKVAWQEQEENYGSRTANFLAFLNADRENDFNLINSQVSALFYYLGRDYSLEAFEDPRFITGRCARIKNQGQSVGMMGEVHPAVLENWGINMPCTVCEIDLDLIKA